LARRLLTVAGPNPTAAQLGAAIRELRTRRHLSIEDLAGVADLHVTYLSRIERGHCSPGWEKIRSLAEAFEIETSALVRLAETLAQAGASQRLNPT
jgi:transcriptional regulator with XRE-family HTH domain